MSVHLLLGELLVANRDLTWILWNFNGSVSELWLTSLIKESTSVDLILWLVSTGCWIVTLEHRLRKTDIITFQTSKHNQGFALNKKNKKTKHKWMNNVKLLSLLWVKNHKPKISNICPHYGWKRNHHKKSHLEHVAEVDHSMWGQYEMWCMSVCQHDTRDLYQRLGCFHTCMGICYYRISGIVRHRHFWFSDSMDNYFHKR